MSNIYIQEPPTSGKVLLKTSVGDIDIELWSRECPKTCRNFVQLCTEGYYNNTIFHRVVKGFIVQGGDPHGDGTGGESIYGQPFRDEFHSRLRYTRRGLVGMANSGKDDNESQFFFTLAATPELQNKNTIFGKVTGDTLFNMLKLEESLVDHNERPIYPHKIIKCEILNNPFNDIVPRESVKEKRKDKKHDKKEKPEGVKNFGLLSFGEEAEEDEEESNQFVQKNMGKPKSLHDVVDDPKLSKEALQINDVHNFFSEEEEERVIKNEELNETELQERRQRIKEKLKRKATHTESKKKSDDECIDEDILLTHQDEKAKEMAKKKEIRREILSLKKEYQDEKKKRDEHLENALTKNSKKRIAKKDIEDNELIKQFVEEKEKYENIKSKLPLKGVNREEFTLNLLSKFRNKLGELRNQSHDESDKNRKIDDCDDNVFEKEIQSDDWLRHTLKFRNEGPVLAKDASTKGDDWYDVYDPRNSLNKRKRNAVDNKIKVNKRRH